MFDRITGNTTPREYVFDQVYAAARTVEFVAEQDIGRTGCGAKPAMSAGSQHFLGRCNIRIGELLHREIGPHPLNSLWPPPTDAPDSPRQNRGRSGKGSRPART